MSVPSPTVEGFRTAFRRPSSTFAEIAWRWTVGTVALTLFLFSLIEYLNSLTVTPADAALLRTRQPLLIGKAVAHIFRGSLNRAVLAALVGAIALTVLWIIAASLGRAASVRALLDYFLCNDHSRRDAACNVAVSTGTGPGHQGEADAVAADTHHGAGREVVLTSISNDNSSSAFRSLAALNALRAAAALAAILAFVGAAILAGLASPDKNPQPGLAFVLFLPFAMAIGIVWFALNWMLSLASIFVVRDHQDALGALSAAVAFSGRRLAPVLAVSIWTALAHLVALSAVGTALSFPLAFSQLIPARLTIASMILLAIAYFAVVDWIYIARLAGYVYITEMPEFAAGPATLPTAPPPGPTAASQTAIDRDEPILSDLPNLALNTPS